MKLTLELEGVTMEDLRIQAVPMIGMLLSVVSPEFAVESVPAATQTGPVPIIDARQLDIPLDEKPKKTRKPRAEKPQAAPEPVVEMEAPVPVAQPMMADGVTEKLRDAAQTYIDSGGTTAHLFGLVAQFGVKNVRSVPVERADEFLAKLAALPKQDATK
jgi:hypothetical protein